MPPEKPLISVVVPAFNAASFLPEAVASIRAQRHEPLEIILVDDGSTDPTAKLVQSWSDVRYIRQPNQGPSAARNTGIDAARSDLLAFLDADDLWTLNHLQVLLAAFQANPAAQFVWGQSQVVGLSEDSSGNRVSEVLNDSVPQFLIGSGLYRRSAFTAVGRFDPKLQLAEDIDWILTARQYGVPQVQLSDTVLIYRRREGSLTSGKNFHELNVMAALKRSLNRHREKQVAAARGLGQHVA
ncbi:MAG: glycosyltransferase family 2 protein [Planctomycetes bacterium]|nr:glycosyltransferase family 2 protein [Planctomycetota bacterium]